MVENQDTKAPQESRVITILGPTATGKTSRAVSICKEFNGEVVSADSRQVYKGMDLGTGKDLEEYGDIPYHLIDICDAGEKYNLHRYIVDFHKVYTDIIERGKRCILCGGSGMYLENVLSGITLPTVPKNTELRARLEKYSLEELTEILKGYKTLHNVTDVDTVKRAVRALEIAEYYRLNPEEAKLADRKAVKPIDSVLIGIDIPREKRRQRITTRLHQRLERGMVDEVRNLLKKGISPEDLIYYGLEYKYLTLYLIGKINYQEMMSGLETAIHQFAKRQMTWFRGMARRGFKINWLAFDMPENEFLDNVRSLMSE